MKSLPIAVLLAAIILASGCTNSENSGCSVDEDCKLIYSSCNCAAVSVNDPRTELESEIICVLNSCPFTEAICVEGKCVGKEPSS